MKKSYDFWSLLDAAQAAIMREDFPLASDLLDDAKLVATEAQGRFHWRAMVSLAGKQCASEMLHYYGRRLLALTAPAPGDLRAEEMQTVIEASASNGDPEQLNQAVALLAGLHRVPRSPLHTFWPMLTAMTRERLIHVFLTLHSECASTDVVCSCKVIGSVLRSYWSLTGKRNERHVGHSLRAPVVLIMDSDASVVDHTTALTNQIRDAGGTCVVARRLSEDFWSVEGPIGGIRRVISSELEEAIAKQSPTHAAFSKPYIGAQDETVTRITAGLSRIQLSYGPFLAGSDYFYRIPNSEFFFDGYLQAETICAQNSWSREVFLDLGLPEELVVLTGDPLMWQLAQTSHHHRKELFDLLWAPHWSRHGFTVRSKGYGNAEHDLASVLSVAEEGAKVLVRAHPALTHLGSAAIHTALTQHNLTFVDPQSLESLLRHPNVSLSNRPITEDILSAKKVLTDGVSIIVYSALLGRPTFVRRRPDAAGFRGEWSDLIEKLPTVRSNKDIQEVPHTSISQMELDCAQTLALCISGQDKLKESPGQSLLTHLAGA